MHQIEKQCAGILDIQLHRDLLPGVDISEQPGITILQSQLEQTLSQVFGPQVSFWEQYYLRKSAIAEPSLALVTHSPVEEEFLHYVARQQYPNFFTTLDAIFYCTPATPEVYELLQLSLQYYLKALLHGALGSSADGRKSIEKAMKIIGPLDVREYREELVGYLG